MFILTFLRVYGWLLFNLAPVLLFLIGIIVLLGIRVAKHEGWTKSRGIYCAFITATTVGYGVVHPTKPRTRSLCIFIALIGLVVTGILVALAIRSMELAAEYAGLAGRFDEVMPRNQP